MEFKKLKVKGDEGEFVLSAYAGPVIKKWGLSFRPTITKDDLGWSTHMSEGFWSLAELTQQILDEEVRFVDMTFFPEKTTIGTDLFDTLVQAKSAFNRWEAGALMSDLDAIFHQLELPLAQEYLSLEWNNEGDTIKGLQGQLSLKYSEGSDVYESGFSDEAHNRIMSILEGIDFKLLDDSFLSSFTAKVIEVEDESLSDGVMEFGDIQVGTNQTTPGCGCVLPIILMIGSSFLGLLFIALVDL